ncbi:hypothetical protein PENTCL1PPCAC_5467, partial [Pristionchus entomophagus]
EPIYAATCAYFQNDEIAATNTCACDDQPLESTASAAFPNAQKFRVAPLSACPAGYTARSLSLKNSKISDYTAPMFVRCRAELWILSATPTTSQFNSWEVVAGACYQ